MSPSHARWWVSSGRSPARFNPRQKRHDPYLTFNGQLEEEITTTRSASARHAALGVGQCRGALVSTMSLGLTPPRLRQPQTKQGHAARAADERLLHGV